MPGLFSGSGALLKKVEIHLSVLKFLRQDLAGTWKGDNYVSIFKIHVLRQEEVFISSLDVIY